MRFLFKIEPYFYASYMLIIGISLGAIIASGAFSAPSIFRAGHIVEDLEITIFQSGVLMTSIFAKLNILLIVLSIFIIIYETLSLRVKKEKICPLLGYINVILTLLFSLYYTPYMIDAQNLGPNAIESDTFSSMHEQSVLVFKTLMATLTLLFIYRIIKRDCKYT